MFKDEQVAILSESGWVRCQSIRDGVTAAGLPLPTAEYLADAFDAGQWRDAESALTELRERFATARFADPEAFGIVLVPDPAKLDTRGPVAPSIRSGQVTDPVDFVDERLPPGRLLAGPGAADWTMAVTVSGGEGPHFGSYEQISNASDPGRYVVSGIDTRAAMIRQVWGARVLQRGTETPDSNDRERWTFSLLCGEDLVDGAVASGTVLHGKVRIRLGKTDRGIASARACPGLVV
jgi:hypothetical protein